MSFIELLVVNYIADFVLQSRDMAKFKSIFPKWLFYHVAIIFVVLFIPVLKLTHFNLLDTFLFCLTNSIIHASIDWNIWRIYKNTRYPTLVDIHGPGAIKYWEDPWFYHTIGFDQLLHITTLYCLYWIFIKGVI